MQTPNPDKNTPEPAGKPVPADPACPPLHADRLTWAVLLARWTDFAQSAVALPDAGDAGLVRRSITDIITLQAVWFALAQIETLDPAERLIGLARGGVLIDRHTAAIRQRFGGQPLPEALDELIRDVHQQYSDVKEP